MPVLGKHLIVRLCLNRTLRQMQRDPSISKEHKDAIYQIWNSSDMSASLQDVVQTHMLDDATLDALTPTASDGSVAGPKDGKYPLLKWLWDNREQIMAFIMEIVKLFHG